VLTLSLAQDPFDAPVPNETYAEGEGGEGEDGGGMEEVEGEMEGDEGMEG